MNLNLQENNKVINRERVRIAVVIGFLLAVFISSTAGEELNELSFLFPEFSISSSVKLDEKSEREARDSDDLIVEVEEKEKPEVRFFIVDFFKSLF